MRNTGICTLIVLFVCALFSGCKQPAKKAGGPDAKIVFLSGKVQQNGKAITKTGIAVAFGDIIATGNDGICRIQIGKKALIQVKKNSKLVYKISDKENTLELESGWLAGISRKVFTSQGTYTIKTPTVTAGVRGTSYCIKVESPKSSYFCVCNGTINLKGKGAEGGKDVSGAHHNAHRYILDEKGKLVVEKAGMEFHGDDSLEKLASAIGEKIDWSKPDKK